MFERLARYQPAVAADLAEQIDGGTFGQVNLFGGERYSLRMTFALECARRLACTGDGSPACRCESCRQFASLTYPNVVIISQRDHRSVIETALNNFVRQRTDVSRSLLIRSVRILLLQYHGALLSDSLSQAQGARYADASAANDLLLGLEAAGDLGEKEAGRFAKDLRAALKNLYAASRKNTTVTVQQVRNIQEWLGRTEVGNQRRFVIIEAIEQTNVSARNSLLKTLEEPPDDTFFFLLSEHPGRIMETILLPCAEGVFPPLAPDAVAALFADLHIESGRYDSIEQYVLAGGGLDVAAVEKQASSLLDSVVSGRCLDETSLSAVSAAFDADDRFAYFCTSLISSVGRAFRDGTIGQARAKRLSACVSSYYGRGTLYNQNRRHAFQAMYYAMMEIA